MELAFLSAVEQAQLVRDGEVSSVELVELYLERIERIDPRLKSFVTVRADEALAVSPVRFRPSPLLTSQTERGEAVCAGISPTDGA